MHIYLKNIPSKFNPIWNDGALGFLKRSPQQEQKRTTRRTRLVAIWDQFLIQKEGKTFSWCRPICVVSERKSTVKHIYLLGPFISSSLLGPAASLCTNRQTVLESGCGRRKSTNDMAAASAGAWPQVCAVHRELNRCNPICCWLKRIQMMLVLWPGSVDRDVGVISRPSEFARPT